MVHAWITTVMWPEPICSQHKTLSASRKTIFLLIQDNLDLTCRRCGPLLKPSYHRLEIYIDFSCLLHVPNYPVTHFYGWSFCFVFCYSFFVWPRFIHTTSFPNVISLSDGYNVIPRCFTLSNPNNILSPIGATYRLINWVHYFALDDQAIPCGIEITSLRIWCLFGREWNSLMEIKLTTAAVSTTLRYTVSGHLYKLCTFPFSLDCQWWLFLVRVDSFLFMSCFWVKVHSWHIPLVLSLVYHGQRWWRTGAVLWHSTKTKQLIWLSRFPWNAKQSTDEALQNWADIFQSLSTRVYRQLQGDYMQQYTEIRCCHWLSSLDFSRTEIG